jgi:hypothetical protein
MMNKRGVSTVEIIVSFTIFLAFVLFILVYVNPIKPNISSSLLANLQTGLDKNAMSDLREVPLITSGVPTRCIKVPLPFNITQGNISVKALNDVIIPHAVSGSYPGGYLYIKNTTDTLYRIIQSDEIDKTDTALSGCGFPYTLSVERDERLFSYKKLVDINNSYYNSYSNLKEQLNYPITSDFEIIISNADVNFTMNRTIPSGVQIKAKQYPIQILKNDIKEDATIALIVW